MELEEFIKRSLVDIYNGVKGANQEISPDGDAYYHIESSSWHKDRKDGYIKFDVAVTAINSSSGKGKAGIQVWSMGIGGEKEKTASDQVVSRIQFGVAPSKTTG